MAFLGARRSVALFSIVLAGLAGGSACYDEGDGTAPPTDTFYFPVGLKVSHGGTVLYAINSDFDLQYNGGTIQSYDLRALRQDALIAIANPTDPRLPLLRPPAPGCPSNPPVERTDNTDTRQTLGETCAPPVDSKHYFRDSVIIGAFATDLLLSPTPSELVPQTPKLHASDPVEPAVATANDRLFAPVRGDATLTWADVVRDDFTTAPQPTDTRTTYPPFRISCGQSSELRCDHAHAVGQDTLEPGNTRHILLPGEPFGVTMSQDGTSLVMTHQNDTKTSLFLSGMGPTIGDAQKTQPSLQYYTPNSPLGGMGLAAIPHDPDAFLGAAVLPKPAYLMTSREVAQVTLLRQYSDENGQGGSSIPRPFLTVENAFSVAASQGATDSRGIVIDDTPRRRCKSLITAPIPSDEYDRQAAACAQKPARAYIANRTPAALLVGEVGGPGPAASDQNTSYDPDRLVINSSWPVATGPSQVYLAPIVDKDGAYALRVFVVCFDAAKIYVFDPEAGTLENVITVGIGPFALAFDPFSMDDVANNAQVPIDARDPNIRRYRFAYVASFTQSYVQMIDLDNAITDSDTYERVVYTIGLPTNPKGS